MKKILGISSFYHDSAAALVVEGKVIAAAQEERFTREKHTADFPKNAIKYCLEEAGLSIDELDAVVFYDKPFLKFERLLETYYSFSPKGIVSFLKSIPIWIKEKLFLKKLIHEGLHSVEDYDKKKLKLLFTEHHLSHAASTFFTSPYEEAAILTIDGVGEWSTATIGYGKAGNITFEKEMHFPHSVGLLYSAFTYYLGFTVNSGEYKVMGLAPYGNPNSKDTIRYVELIKSKLIEIKNDGSIWMNQSYFNYLTGLKMIKEKKWEELFELPKRAPESDLEQQHCNIALAVQLVIEEIVIKMAYEAKKITGSNNICLAGGVALNCVANGKLLKESVFNNMYIQTASGDAGGAVGAALSVNHMYFKQPRIQSVNDTMEGAYLGPEYSDKEIILMSRKVKAVYHKHEEFESLTNEIADKITKGKVVGWFQGRMEFGPRALGNRSILGDATNSEMQKKINLKIKYREGFRPFAPSVLAEDTNLFFELETDSPYMLLVAPIVKSRRKALPKNFHSLPLKEKLYFQRSDIQAVTHLDFSARIQTVHKETNKRYWELINQVKKVSGNGLVLNTSFNVRGEPIVCSPYDAFRCFMSTEMDVLVINNFIYYKEEQFDYQDRNKWAANFKMD